MCTSCGSTNSNSSRHHPVPMGPKQSSRPSLQHSHPLLAPHATCNHHSPSHPQPAACKTAHTGLLAHQCPHANWLQPLSCTKVAALSRLAAARVAAQQHQRQTPSASRAVAGASGARKKRSSRGAVGRAGRFSSAEDAVILQLEYRIGMNWDAVMEADDSDGQVLANRTPVSASVGVGSTYNALSHTATCNRSLQIAHR